MVGSQKNLLEREGYFTNPFLSRVLSALVEIFTRTQRLSSGSQIRLDTKLGLKRRLDLLFACETLFPERGRLPVIGHTFDMI